jgi:hypothetical protein
MLNISPPSPYMTDEDWPKVRRFKPSENWGNWRRVHRDLIFTLDAFAEFVQKPVIIHNAYDQTGHTDGSYHYKGMAVDFHVKGLNVFDQFLAVVRFDGFNGLGVYPFWNNPGIHGDIRPKSNRLLPDSLWMRNGAGEYISLTWQNLKEALK